jgi:hypothetical protein
MTLTVLDRIENMIDVLDKQLLTYEKILDKVESITCDDFCSDIEMELYEGDVLSKKEKIMAEKLRLIYRLIHGHNPKHSCYDMHEDWRAELISRP